MTIPIKIRKPTFLENLNCIYIRLLGTIVKGFSYIFHLVLPKYRFSIPSSSFNSENMVTTKKGQIPRIVWQTNFSEKCTLPIWLNYKFNLGKAKSFEFKYVSTEERGKYLKDNFSDDIYEAYSRLTDGAAQADLWRMAVLYREGGVYLDIDAILTQNLEKLLDNRKLLFIASHANRPTNYFIATTQNNPIFKETLNQIVSNILNYKEGNDVFTTTGPRALRTVLENYSDFEVLPRKSACLTGVFTNEHFQYLDKPGSKWCYKKTFITQSSND